LAQREACFDPQRLVREVSTSLMNGALDPVKGLLHPGNAAGA